MEAHSQEWKRLVDCAVRVKKLAPWEWMDEEDIFGIRHPETGVLGFVSVMGALGEHSAVGVYLGTAALAGFLELQQAPHDSLAEYPELLLELPQLQASFEDRDGLEDWDRQLLRNLNLKFRGSKAWPRFQSFRPGFMPWRLEREEISFLTLALEQLELVAPRLQEESDFLMSDEADTFMIRSCLTREGKIGEWAERFERLPPPEFPKITLEWDAGDAEKLRRLPARKDIIEFDVFMFPGRIGEKGQRPEVGYVALAVHAQSSMILGAEILGAAEGIEPMLGQIPGWILSRLAGSGLRPKEIHVQSPRLPDVLRPAFKELGTKIVFKPELKKLRAAKQEMFAYFSKR
jgi:hypothetical protein